MHASVRACQQSQYQIVDSYSASFAWLPPILAALWTAQTAARWLLDSPTLICRSCAGDCIVATSGHTYEVNLVSRHGSHATLQTRSGQNFAACAAADSRTPCSVTARAMVHVADTNPATLGQPSRLSCGSIKLGMLRTSEDATGSARELYYWPRSLAGRTGMLHRDQWLSEHNLQP